MRVKMAIITKKYEEVQDALETLQMSLIKVESTKSLDNEVDLLESKNRCNVCNENISDLHRHICLDRTNIKCEYCSGTFKSTYDLCRHLTVVQHPEMKLYKCNKCSMGFSTALLLHIHQQSKQTHIELIKLDPFQCYICKATFRTQREVKLHLRQHVAARDKKCEICDEMLTSNELNQHICDMGSSIDCEYCSSSFNATAKLLQHLENEHDDKTLYRCKKCHRFFATERLRDLHEERHKDQPKPFICDVCSKGFADKKLLRKHLEIHSTESMQMRFFFSKLANNLFDFSFNAGNHLCSECGQGFKTAYNLKSHSRTHLDAKFQCTHCPSSFRHNQYLKHHLDIHKNLKYSCNECDKICVSKMALMRHIGELIFV